MTVKINMTVESAKYIAPDDTIGQMIEAKIDNATIFVPLDPNNRHYQAIQEWVKEGNKIEDAD
jgi:hypothetical protein|tara:strand:+ start:1077 stop:1265 length:189 start_codon:yes stop_codon:yes gene_type:complete